MYELILQHASGKVYRVKTLVHPQNVDIYTLKMYAMGFISVTPVFISLN